MNCEHCQNLLSDLVDRQLEYTMSAEVESHLQACDGCAGLYRDFSDLTEFCTDYQAQEITPPNSQALWCRISNIIESETEVAAAASVAATEEPKKKGFWASAWDKRWQLSFSQAVTAVIGIAVVSSLLTIVGVKNVIRPADINAKNTPPTLFETMLSKAGLAPAPEELREKSLSEKQSVIDYWSARVTARKGQWSHKVRETFDRNLQEIDQVVFEYSQNLRENPSDSLSEEMLNSAMTEKMDLLREFSEL